MKILASLLATAALVGGVMIANAQQSGSPTAPSGPMAGGGSASSATQGVEGTQRIETTGQATTTKKGAKAAPKKPAPKGSGSSSELRYHITRSVVHHSKICRRLAAMGQKRRPI